MLSKLISERLDWIRQRQLALVTRNVRIIEGARPGKRAERMRRVIARTKPLRDLEERLERSLRQALNDESFAAHQARMAAAQ